MSRGPGRVERTIATIFANAPPLTIVTMSDLVACVYPGEAVEKKHRVAILRAVKKVLPHEWTMGRGGLLRDGDVGAGDWTFGVPRGTCQSWGTWWYRRTEDKIRRRMLREAHYAVCYPNRDIEGAILSHEKIHREVWGRDDPIERLLRVDVIEELIEFRRAGGSAEDFYRARGEIPPKPLLLSAPTKRPVTAPKKRPAPDNGTINITLKKGVDWERL
jgi:hypothetical protein